VPVAVALVALLVVVAVLVLRRNQRAPVRVLAEAVPPAVAISGDVDPIGALDALLAELERTTVRIDGADELDESAVAELERLADKLEAAAAGLERVG
jgi:hypothetical protein